MPSAGPSLEPGASPPPSAGRVLVTADIGPHRCAFPLAAVDEVLRMVAVTPVPSAPPFLEGVVDVRGEVVPVIGLRAGFRLPPQAPALADRLILMRTSRRRLAVHVERIPELIEVDAEAVAAPVTDAGAGGFVKAADGLIVIHDLERLLSVDEEAALEAVMTAVQQEPVR